MTQGESFSLAGVQLFSYPDAVSGSGGFEVPADLKLKMSTWISIHRLPAGPGQPARKIAQTFGVFVDPISWEAQWLGPNADQKSRTIAAICAARQPVTLQFSTYTLTVIVTKYEITSHSRYEIGYMIELEPLVDNSGLLSNQPDLLTAEQQLTSQYNSIVGYEGAPPDTSGVSSSIATAVANAQIQLSSTSSVIAAAQPESASSIAALLSVAKRIADTIEVFQDLRDLVASNTDTASAGIYLWAVQALGALQSYQSTLASMIGSDGTRTETVSGTDLISIASQYLGDWTRWTDIAVLNGLADPYLDVPTLLKIPPARQGSAGS